MLELHERPGRALLDTAGAAFATGSAERQASIDALSCDFPAHHARKAPLFKARPLSGSGAFRLRSRVIRPAIARRSINAERA